MDQQEDCAFAAAVNQSAHCTKVLLVQFVAAT